MIGLLKINGELSALWRPNWPPVSGLLRRPVRRHASGGDVE